jgi:pimeloyl-ACP methyl ester carboxylesterase
MKTAYHPFRSEQAKSEYLAHYDESAKHWPLPSESKLIEGAYGQTFVRITGPKDAPPLVLFHGAGSSSLMWNLNIEALSRNYRTYAVDSLINTGCVGRSIYTKPIRGADDANQWLDELFNKLGLGDEINLLGASYGGWLASQYALYCPKHVRKLVLVAPAGTVLPFRGIYMLRAILLSIMPSRFMARNFLRWSFPDLLRKDRRIVDTIADEILLSMRSLEPVNPGDSPKLTALSDEELQRIDVPTLVLIGENETLYSAQEALARLQSVAPQIQSELIPNAGHDIFLVQLELITQKILAFLADRYSDS